MSPFPRTLTAGLALAAAIFGPGELPAADPVPVALPAIPIPLTRAKNNKLLLRADAPGGPAWMLIDTGAPRSCADESKAALFHFKPFPKDARPPAVISNGIRNRMISIPELNFGGIASRDFAVELINIARINQQQQLNHDISYDGVLGLNDLRRMHAVIDCGAGTLLLNSDPARDQSPAGWIAVPMKLLDNHLIVPGIVNGAQTHFCVDTGSPQLILDLAFCRSLRIPVKTVGGNVEAPGISQSPQIATIANLRIGPREASQGAVLASDLTRLIGPQQHSIGVAGFIGSDTLEALKAIIDCESLQLYLKQR